MEDTTNLSPKADASLYNGQPSDTGSSCPSAGLTSRTPSISEDTRNWVSVENVPNGNKQWFVLRVSYGRIDKAKTNVEAKGMECYVPLQYKEVRKQGKKRIITTPLLPSLIFIHATAEQAEALLHDNKVVANGEYCFMFDKQYWEGFWERNWKKEYGIKSDEKVYLMPWQIIPIEANVPISLDTSGYNVITYIKITNTSSLEKKIIKLLSNSQFLLFLRCKNIQMTFVSNNDILANVNKKCNDNIVILSSNGKEDSRWLTYTNPEVEVPKELYSDIKADINTPQKLKDAKTFDLSFAIQIDNNSKIKSLDKEDAVIYTYLPTSFRFGNEGFPFLVNANFITDAGRQQLHKDSEWNKLIFSKIPSEYLNWMKEISSTFSNYYEVLPKKSYGSNNALEETFATEMVKAINDIAFIPRANNAKSKVLASSAVMDKMGMSEAISKKLLTTHINRTYNKDFSEKE